MQPVFATAFGRRYPEFPPEVAGKVAFVFYPNAPCNLVYVLESVFE